jgi:hypothetical protein
MAQQNDHLAQFIAAARTDARIASYTHLQLKQAVALKILSLLGWDAFNASEVVPDFNAGGMTIDYALQTPSGSIFLHVVNPLDERTTELQDRVIKTAAGNNVTLAVLTDGLRWGLYVPMAHASLYDKEFCRVDFRHDDPQEASSTLKKAIARRIAVSGTAFTRAEKTFNDRLKRKHETLSTSVTETWARILDEAHTVFTELLIVEAKRVAKQSVSKKEAAAFYGAFAKLATAPEAAAKKMKYEADDDTLATAWTGLLGQLQPVLTELMVNDIERVHQFRADRSAVESFIASVRRSHEAASSALARKK